MAPVGREHGEGGEGWRESGEGWRESGEGWRESGEGCRESGEGCRESGKGLRELPWSVGSPSACPMEGAWGWRDSCPLHSPPGRTVMSPLYSGLTGSRRARNQPLPLLLLQLLPLLLLQPLLLAPCSMWADCRQVQWWPPGDGCSVH